MSPTAPICTYSSNGRESLQRARYRRAAMARTSGKCSTTRGAPTPRRVGAACTDACAAARGTVSEAALHVGCESAFEAVLRTEAEAGSEAAFAATWPAVS